VGWGWTVEELPLSQLSQVCGQDLLRGVANMEILCHGALAVDFTARCSSCSMTDSLVTNVVGYWSEELRVVDICMLMPKFH